MAETCSNDNKYKPGDLVNHLYPGEIPQMPTWELTMKICIVASMELIGIVGNILIIVIVFRTKKMRTVTNYYIVNMAVSDFLVACFSIWMHLVHDVTDGWVVGGFLCKFNPFLQSKYVYCRNKLQVRLCCLMFGINITTHNVWSSICKRQ